MCCSIFRLSGCNTGDNNCCFSFCNTGNSNIMSSCNTGDGNVFSCCNTGNKNRFSCCITGFRNWFSCCSTGSGGINQQKSIKNKKVTIIINQSKASIVQTQYNAVAKDEKDSKMTEASAPPLSEVMQPSVPSQVPPPSYDQAISTK